MAEFWVLFLALRIFSGFREFRVVFLTLRILGFRESRVIFLTFRIIGFRELRDGVEGLFLARRIQGLGFRVVSGT